ncbi:MAG: poly-gamma-glutamate hydrolase family protein [Candidatus Binatia bacterium]
MDTYNDFAELARNTKEGRDFCVRLQNRPGTTVVIASHGGGIERGTSEIAEAIAGDDHSFYMFKGIRSHGNKELHITATHFDEPRCMATVNASPHAIVIHGERSSQDIAFLGGRDEAMLNRLHDLLVAEGFNVQTHNDLQGRDEENICNRVQSKRGVQLELSKGLRLSFFEALTKRGCMTKTERFEQFVAVVRQAIL